MIDYNQKPILIFWETTKACGLACTHCRASAMENPLPDELTDNETLKLLRKKSNLGGLCGACEWGDSCGGSRSRAYARYGDIFAQDPACLYSDPNTL